MDGARDAAQESHPSGRQDPPFRGEAALEVLRGRALEAVAECCTERGYAATTVEQIARRAGISRPQFDALFRDKEDAYIAMSNLVLGELLTAATGAYSPENHSSRLSAPQPGRSLG